MREREREDEITRACVLVTATYLVVYLLRHYYYNYPEKIQNKEMDIEEDGGGSFWCFFFEFFSTTACLLRKGANKGFDEASSTSPS